MTNYLSGLKYCSMVIGNSSSGLVEAPSFGIPTINIGDRQKGRLQASSIINCMSEQFVKKAKKTANPYGGGDTSDKVIKVVKEYIYGDKINLKKKFYDCVVK